MTILDLIHYKYIKENTNWLLTGHFIGKWASWFSFVAILISIQAEFKSTLGLAFLIAAKRLPASIAAYRSGLMTQTKSPKSIILSAFSIILFFIFSLLIGNPHEKSFILYCAIGYIGISFAEGFYRPALAQLTSQLFRTQKSRISVNTNLNMLGMLSIVVATSASGILMSFLSVKSIILISGISAAISLFCFSKIKYVTRNASSTIDDTTLNPQKSNLLFAPEQRGILVYYGLLALLYSFIGIVATKFPFEVYHMGTQGVGITNLVLGIGIICGGLLYKTFLKNSLSRQNTNSSLDRKIVFLITSFFLGFTLVSQFTLGMMFLFSFILCFSLLKIHLENKLILLSENNTGVLFSQLSIFEEALISVISISFGLLSLNFSLKTVGISLSAIIFVVCLGVYTIQYLYQFAMNSPVLKPRLSRATAKYSSLLSNAKPLKDWIN